MNRLIKALVLAVAMVFASPTIAQQPQTQTAPLYAVNAKYTNGVAPGYYATSGGGLTLNIGGGTVFCAGTIAQYAGGNLSMTASTTNYVYLNAGSGCVPSVKTSVFASTDIPLFEVVTSGSAITSVLDVRTPFNTATSGGGISSFAAPSGSWPSWLVPTVTNPTTTPSLAVAASPIPNSALANPATTVNGQTCTLGSTCTVGPTGTGSTSFIPIWSSSSVLGSSLLDENQSNANQLTVGDTLGVDSMGGLTLTSSLSSGLYAGAYFSSGSTNTFGALSNAGSNIYNYSGSSTKLCSIPTTPGTQFTNILASTSCSFEFNGSVFSILPGAQATSGTPGIGSAAVRVVAMGFNKGIIVSNAISGTGYSGIGTCTVTGGTFTVQATCIGQVSGVSPFPLQIIVTNPGIYSVVPTGFTLSGWTFTTPSTASPALAGGGAGASQNGTWSILAGVQGASPFSSTFSISAPLQPPTSGPATIMLSGGSNGGYNFQLDAPTNSGSIGATFTQSALTTLRTYTLPNANGTFMVSLTTTGTTGAATFSGGVLNIPNYSAGSSGVTSINTVTGAFTFTGSGVSCVSTTCTFSGSGAPAFNTVTAGTNTAALVMGTGGSLSVSGSGTIAATSAPASGLTGSTLASGVTASSLTSLGTIVTGVWQGTAVGAQWGGIGINTSGSTGCPSVTSGTWSIVTCGTGTVTGTGTNGFVPLWTSTTAIGNSFLDYAVTTAGTFTFSKPVAINATGTASQFNLTPSGTSPATVAGAASLGVPNTVSTAGVYLLPAAPGSGVYTGTNASGIVTTTFTPLNGAGAGIPTGPTSSTTNNAVIFTGTAGQIADSGGPMPATIAAVSHQFLTSYTKSTGVFTLAQPTLADIAAGATSTGTYDFSGATQIKLPVAAAYTSAANGEIGYDTTNLNWHIWDNAADNFVAVFPVASPPTTGNCAKFVKTTNTWTLADAGTTCGGGGSLPTGTTGQGLYYAAGGTTVTPTSDIIHTGATGGSPLGFNNPTPLSVFDFVGAYSHFGAGPASNTTTNGSLTNVATSMTVVSTNSYPPSGYLLVGSNNFAPEIMSYSSITSGTVFGGLTRSLFGTTAANPQATGANVLLISAIQGDSNATTPSYMKLWKGSVYCYPSTNNLINSSTTANGNFGCGNLIYANTFVVGSGANGASIGTNGTGFAFANTSSANIAILNGAGLLTTTGNSVTLTTATTITATSLTTTGLVLPSIPISTTIHGHCSIIWEQNTVVGTVQFGIGGSNAPTDLYVMNKIFPGTTVVPAYTTITSATTTAISATTVPGATATGYAEDIDFTMITGATNAVVLTIYGLTSVGSSALIIEPGSSCGWLL